MKKRIKFLVCAALVLAHSLAPAGASAAESVPGNAALTAGSPFSHPAKPSDGPFLNELRQALASGKPVPAEGSELEKLHRASSFPKKFWGFVMVLYEPGFPRYKALSTKKDEWEDIRRTVNAAMIDPRLKKMHPADADRLRIQLDFILEPPKSVRFEELTQTGVGPERFEFGVDGLLATDGKKTVYFLPGEAYVQSILSLNAMARSFRRSFAGPGAGALAYKRFRSESYVSYKDRWLKLYRGHPVMGPLTKNGLRWAAKTGSEYLKRTQKKDGRFLYYYDSAADSFRDHEHPGRDPKKNGYYNELRHAGGAMLWLYDYRETKDASLIDPVKKAIAFMRSLLVRYKTAGGEDAAYVYYNRKAKLGGSGLFLYLLSEYKRLTGDASYDEDARLLARHLTADILPSGEFMYYHVYLDQPVTPERNRTLFSFYYPGEALIGLAAYYKNTAAEAEKPALAGSIRRALSFLIEERPKIYAGYYAPLPSDSWLMMAISEMWDAPELRDEKAKQFVFDDAEKMVAHMYRAADALYPDYRGAFYYNYGDFPYADGARAEGLTGALELAVKVGDAAKTERFYEALKEAAWATLHLVNTPESAYSVQNRPLTIGGIRFKHTRQWFRVDTIQHVAAFYFKLIPYLRRDEK